MEELAPGSKVTRLRRRLSVEAEDVKSPATQSTPTKKRGGRLAAKPQLELIDEKDTETVPKRTRRSTVKDVTEPADDKPVTPARRNTRARSNNSILSETPSVGPSDEKPMTPARRSARIRSNTSLVSETAINFDSPRAKRAARRTSQVGSDTEAPITPARQTRRNRKDSASSVDKGESNSANIASQIVEVIAEEAETNLIESNNHGTAKNDSPSLRKSPRLVEKGGKKSSVVDNDDKENQPQSDKETSVVNDKKGESEEPVQIEETTVKTSPITVDLKRNKEVESKNTEKANLSITSVKLIEQMDTNNKKTYTNLNKTTSVVEESNEFKSKRHRTKSWSTISVPAPADGNFYSDNEISKKKKRGGSNIDLANKSGSGDGLSNSKTNIEYVQDITLNTSTKSAKKRHSKKFLTEDVPEENTVATELKSSTVELEQTERKKSNQTEELFKKSPTGVVHTLVYIEDSDSNTGSIGKEIVEKQIDSGDQCVPVIENKLVEETCKQSQNDSCEPMDIDETIPDNGSILLVTEKNNSQRSEKQNGEKRKSSICIPSDNDKSFNKSKRKSSIGNIESQIIDKTENRSTLVLSQIKDISTNEVTSETYVTKSIVDTNEPLSKSVNVDAPDKNKDIDKINLSLNYLTSTPLQQKSLKKIGMQINTSIITPCDKTEKDIPVKSENEKSITSEKSSSNIIDNSNSKSEDVEDEDSEDSSEEESKLIIDDEAQEASDDYESGDSRDKEELQYEKDHEIREKGETLNSDDEQYSGDSDYEKDSFIVSSDEDDDDLLSGSGDDLSMSADELSMSAKSKKKYNERKNKERKKASKEMFQARHGLDESEIKKSKKAKNVKRLDSSDSENDVIVEKKRRQRIDSSQDISVDVDKSISIKKKKTRRLSDSVCEGNVSEKEITISEDVTDNKDPLSIQNKPIKEEPKTPMKDLNITTVQVANIEDVEQIHVNENVSVLKSNETSDPLQATVTQNEEDDSDDIDSLSENEEIALSYDSMLNQLNNAKPKQIKTLDISLNINKKTKQTAKEPVIDQLNLTQTKKSKKNKKKTEKSAEYDIESKVNNVSVNNKSSNKSDAANEDSSDSIDMKLLFPEDSNDSETNNAKAQKPVEKEDTTEVVEEFIPLKRTVAKTNITESIVSHPNDSALNESKKKKRKSSLAEQIISMNEREADNEVSFFIDTTGTHTADIETNILNKSSGKKNKSKRNSESEADTYDIKLLYSPDRRDVSLQNSFTKSKIKDASLVHASKDKDNTIPNEIDTSIKKSAKKNKSMNNSALVNNAEIKDDFTDSNEIEQAVSVKDNGKKNKEKKKHLTSIDADEIKDTEPLETDTSITHSSKKKKNKRAVNIEENVIDDDIILLDSGTPLVTADVVKEVEVLELNTSVQNSSKKNKKKDKNLSFDITEVTQEDVKEEDTTELVIGVKSSGKKNKNRVHNDSLVTSEEIKDIDISGMNSSIERSAKKNQKKNKNLSLVNIEETQDDVKDDHTNEQIIDVKSSAKKNKIKVHNDSLVASEEIKDIDVSGKNTSIEQSAKKTKKNKNAPLIIIEEPQMDDTIIELDTSIKHSGKKKRREALATNETENNDISEVNTSIKSSVKKNKKNSRALHESEDIINLDEDETNVTTMNSGKKKRMNSKSVENIEEVKHDEDIVQIFDEEHSKKRKRKSSANANIEEIIIKDDKKDVVINEPLVVGSQNKKRKISHNEVIAAQGEGSSDEAPEEVFTKKIKKKNKRDRNLASDEGIQDTSSTKKDGKQINTEDQSETEVKKLSKKRKERDDDDSAKTSKVLKQNSFDKIHVPRLPANILKQLDDKPKNQSIVKKKASVISTTSFVVEEAKRRRNKPSNYLEQSVYLDDTVEEKTRKPSIKIPKVSPFLPTASISDSGYTTKFRVNVTHQEPQFIAQSSDVVNFKNDHIHKEKLKKFGTFEKYKKQRNVKLSKF